MRTRSHQVDIFCLASYTNKLPRHERRHNSSSYCFQKGSQHVNFKRVQYQFRSFSNFHSTSLAKRTLSGRFQRIAISDCKLSRVQEDFRDFQAVADHRANRRKSPTQRVTQKCTRLISIREGRKREERRGRRRGREGSLRR